MAVAGAHKILTSTGAVKSPILRKRTSNLYRWGGRSKAPMSQLARTWPLKETRRRWPCMLLQDTQAILCLKENFSLKTPALRESPLLQVETFKETILCMSSTMDSQRLLHSTREKSRGIRISLEEDSPKATTLIPSSWMIKNPLARQLLPKVSQEVSHRDIRSLCIDGSRASTFIPGSIDPTFRAKISQNSLTLWVWAWIRKWPASSGQ